MSDTSEGGAPVVEPKPTGGDAPDLTLRALRLRIRQQEILAELGVSALQGASFDQLLADTARLTAEGLRVEFCKVLEFLAAKNILLVRAGVGWNPGVIGVASVGADLASPAGFALRTGKPVISNHLADEARFSTPEILRQHGVRRAMNVILQGDGTPFGVLEVDSKSKEEFEVHDLAFLQGAANILGMAIERERHERRLKAALERDKVLLKEMNHRIKNSLSIVASMLRLQSNDGANAEVAAQLSEASHRVEAISKAHDQLSHSADVERMDVGRYLRAICEDFSTSGTACEILVEAEDNIFVATDRAISLALIVNELITNATKYAYQGRPDGEIRVRIAREGAGGIAIAVRDAGVGLPADFDMRKAKGLGMRIISSLMRPLNATIAIRACDPGTEFTVSMPLQGQ